MSEDFRFELWQEGIMVAAVNSPNYHRGLREIAHYANVYAQDGPVQIKEKSSHRKPEEKAK